MRRGWLTVHRAKSGRKNAELAASARGLAKKSLGHWTATDIAGAYEQNGFHAAQRFKVSRGLQIVNPKSKVRPAHDRETFD
jgi:hypothetical protein